MIRRGLISAPPAPWPSVVLDSEGLWAIARNDSEDARAVLAASNQAGVPVLVPAVVLKGTGCGLTASYAWIVPAGHTPPGISHRKPTAVINGIRVYRRPSGPDSVLYLVPELSVRVGAHGPLGRRVLATLNRSPLSVVLGKGRASPVPARWVWHRFGGVRFAAPRTWHRHRQTQWATCGTGVVPGSLVLIDAIKPPLALPRPARSHSPTLTRSRPSLA